MRGEIVVENVGEHRGDDIIKLKKIVAGGRRQPQCISVRVRELLQAADFDFDEECLNVWSDIDEDRHFFAGAWDIASTVGVGIGNHRERFGIAGIETIDGEVPDSLLDIDNRRIGMLVIDDIGDFLPVDTVVGSWEVVIIA